MGRRKVKAVATLPILQVSEIFLPNISPGFLLIAHILACSLHQQNHNSFKNIKLSFF